MQRQKPKIHRRLMEGLKPKTQQKSNAETETKYPQETIEGTETEDFPIY